MPSASGFIKPFPDDILHLVFKQLQPKSSPRQLGYLPVLLQPERDKQKALYNLVLTSKTFHARAVPILYAVVLPCAPYAPPLDTVIEIDHLSSSFAASPTRTHYSYIRELHLVFLFSTCKEEHGVVLDILETCAGTVQALCIQGNTYHHHSLIYRDRLLKLLARCYSLQNLSVCFPFASPTQMYAVTRELSAQTRVLSSLQLHPTPAGPLTQEADSPKPSLEVEHLHIQPGGRHIDLLHTMGSLCRPDFLQSISFRGSADWLWKTASYRYGPWDNLKKIHLEGEVSWEPLRFDPALASQAVKILPSLEALRTTLPWAAQDLDLVDEMRCYPSNLVRLHIDKFWWKVPSLLADLLIEEPAVLPCLRQLELGLFSLNIQRKQVALKKPESQPDGAEALQTICRMRGIKTEPENLMQEPVWEDVE
jgi:hypothetical protein